MVCLPRVIVDHVVRHPGWQVPGVRDPGWMLEVSVHVVV